MTVEITIQQGFEAGAVILLTGFMCSLFIHILDRKTEKNLTV